MASLAGLLIKLGHQVTGSDQRFYPPMSDVIAKLGIQTFEGYRAQNIDAAKPERVIIGNVVRADNPEALRARAQKLECWSMAHTLREVLLNDRRSLVIAGTHGKTTSTALAAYLLEGVGADPGYLIGGMPIGAATNVATGHSDGFFVIEGDEYDSAYFEKQPKFWSYNPYAALITSIEHDHLDIYPDEESYLVAFRGLVERVTAEGRVVAFAGDARVREIVKKSAAPVEYYALNTDHCGDVTPVWSAALADTTPDYQAFDFYVGGSYAGRAMTRLYGEHNVRNALGVIALLASAGDFKLRDLIKYLGNFRGIKRRQELLGHHKGIYVYDDFAHHPTAVGETIAALKRRHPGEKLIAVFEPRSATACRNIHQEVYPRALASADVVYVAPLGRANLHESERLDIERVVSDVRRLGPEAHGASSLDALYERLKDQVRGPAVVLFMSNGDFGGLPKRFCETLV